MSGLLRIGGIAFAVLAVCAAFCEASPPQFPGRDDPSTLLDRPAPPLRLERWIGSSPLEIEHLRGDVVLVRWWTDTCPFCASSAGSLVRFHEQYAEDGLVVIGVFHPKPPGDASDEQVRRAMKRFGFEFPVAVDADWSALRRWWLDHGFRWTSVSFVVDRDGVIRYIHPGGEYHTGEGADHWPDHSSCRREYEEIEAVLQRLLDAAPGP